ncbi:MAG TPA: substrate-binding domain-containing protein [Bradyrhizobium sp.]|jgi:molybdate transport system substrate-binding protein|uniref:substrate-binding domain-containing protein n=1 Tax=Bradyrhizobium sp. TaxID=376 RepID=UPI002C980002|nr:substrate-binding domain-containing protein [Bradyrhizobium sp.]HTA99787.1 substrate-binding domain-containing protein [Bradyrhizobium sp.]
MLKRVLVLAGFAALMGAISPARATQITVMSGAAVEAGLVIAVEAFRQQTGDNVQIVFATTPEISRRVGAGETPDVVIATPAALDDLVKSGKIEGTGRVPVGRVGIGVAIREGAPKPDVSTTDALKRAVLDADSVIYNRASSGLFVESLLQRLGLAEQIQGKTKRYAGTDMIEPLIKGKGNEIGFMPVAEILHFRNRGLQLAGPLPEDVQNYTSYAAQPASKSAVAMAFVRFLETPESKGIFAAAGIE